MDVDTRADRTALNRSYSAFHALWPRTTMRTAYRQNGGLSRHGTSSHANGRMTMRSGNARYSADSNVYVTTTLAEGSGCVGCEFHDEVGVEGCADPFQQRNGGDDAARFKP
jgi:hypothetical protein